MQKDGRAFVKDRKMKQENLKIKVCGMRYPENLEQLCDLGPEFVGFIFYPRSGRFVGDNPNPALFEIPGPGTAKVGVFVNEEISRVRRAVRIFNLDAVQLHGEESVEYCGRLSGEVMVLKALDPNGNRSEIESYGSVVDYLLFDTPGDGYGGSGQKFDWKLLNDLQAPAPFLLSGGIAPGDADAIRCVENTGIVGVDLNSRFELSPGRKDIQELKKFIIEIRK